MSFSDFTLDRARRALALEIVAREDLFEEAPEREISPLLSATLEENVPLAKAINTEKARSELIVSPILVEVRRLLNHQVSLFSGVNFDVDQAQGLIGTCDFIVARSPSQWVLRSPVVTIIEAKNDNIKAGLGQCVATMFAARLFNEREDSPAGPIFGAVTTGTLWQFLRLDGPIVGLDERDYHIEKTAKILGILTWMLGDGGGQARLVA